MNWQTETGKFTYKKIRKADQSDFDPNVNLKIKDGEASLVDVNSTEGLEVSYIKIYNLAKEEIADLTTLVNDQTYYVRILCVSKEGRVWMEQMTTFTYPTSAA